MSVLEVFEQHQFSGDIDGIITTVPIQIEGYPIIEVSPMLSPDDKERIQETLGIGPSSQKPITPHGETEGIPLAGLMHARTIQVQQLADNWEEVVELAGETLYDLGAIETSYIQAMKDLIVQHGPYMVIMPGIALLHARPEQGARQLGMSLITLRNPVVFGHPQHDPVRLAIALAAVDDFSHIRALLELVEMLQDRQFVDRICQSGHAVEVSDLIKGYAHANTAE
jgi:mannitol/fructose-specific phosphotransferase system IIA component (Ntr-type)